jgi:iron complex outermembrane receptor protein
MRIRAIAALSCLALVICARAARAADGGADARSAAPVGSAEPADAGEPRTDLTGETADAASPGDAPLRLDATVVTATRAPTSLRDVPAAVSVVDQRAIHEARPTVSLAEPLSRVPGTLVQDAGNQAQGPRIQIRGFGTRSAFGIREIRVLLDGLPQTLPDGQTELGDVDLESIARIEVLRGPASSLYGNASGGVIQLFTEDPPETPTVESRTLAGSYGLLKTSLKGGATSGDVGVFVQGSYFSIGGYRDHATAYDGTVAAKLLWTPAETTRVTFLLNAADAPLAQDPGGLTWAQAEANPRQARDVNVLLDAGEAVQQGRVGAVLEHRTGAHALSAYGYALYRDFDSRQPIVPANGDGAVAFRRTSPGGGLRYDLSVPLAGFAQTLTVGLDAQAQNDARRRWANVDGARGALGVSERETVQGVGAYLREAVFVTDDLQLSGGVRYDDVAYAIDVSFPTGEPDAARSFGRWSPAGGVLWTAQPWLSTYVNVGTAFQVPTTTELANPDGAGFAAGVEPQLSTSWEIGARAGQAGTLEGGVAAYLLEVDDELVPFEAPSGRTAFRNAGRSRRIGVELDGQARLTPWLGTLLGGDLDWTGSFTAIDAQYRDYATTAGVFDGNDEPGIPPWQVYQQLAWRRPEGAFVAIEGLFVGGMYVDDANDARARGYPLVNLRAGLEREVGRLRVSPFVGVQNVADASYAAVVRLNALGGRFYEPAPGVNVYGGVSIAARL